jgi:hypothetical protein
MFWTRNRSLPPSLVSEALERRKLSPEAISVPETATLNVQVAVFADASVAVQVTVVTPTPKAEPDAGEQVTETPPGQLSVAVGVVYVTTFDDCPAVAVTLIFAGQAIVGGCVSLTLTVKLQVEVLPAASATEQLTVVVPFGKTEPEAGEHTGVPTPGQLSLTVTA